MSLDFLGNVRRRAVAFGALSALAIPACASDRGETVATVPAGMAMPPAMASEEAPKTASAPLGYPWASGGRGMTTASARASNSVVR